MNKHTKNLLNKAENLINKAKFENSFAVFIELPSGKREQISNNLNYEYAMEMAYSLKLKTIEKIVITNTFTNSGEIYI